MYIDGDEEDDEEQKVEVMRSNNKCKCKKGVSIEFNGNKLYNFIIYNKYLKF